MTQVLHSTDVVVAALAYAGDLMRLRSRACARAGGDAGEEGAAGAPGLDAAAGEANAGLGRETLEPHAAGQPHSLRERVLQAFSTHDLPVHKPLSLPTLSLELACPGEHIYINACSMRCGAMCACQRRLLILFDCR